MIAKIINKVKLHLAHGGEKEFIKYLRGKGVTIGEKCHFGEPKTITIDLTRPYLIEIGDNVRMNKGFTLLTHDFTTSTLQNVYKEFIPSSGKVKIGNNVYFAQKCTVLKGVTIGNNCIIGYGSLVTKDIPDNSVVAGSPARIICTIEEYYKKRKKASLIEAFKLIKEFEDKYHREPGIEDFNEEYFFFISGNEANNYPNLPIKRKLSTMDGNYEIWEKNYKAPYKSIEEFLDAAHLYNNEGIIKD